MSLDNVLKKSAFGGFKKEGVLNYVEQLQAEILSLKKDLNNSVASDEENRKLEKRCEAYECEIGRLKKENSLLEEKNDALVSENIELMNRIKERESAVSDYENKISVCENKLAEIEKKFSEIETLYNKSAQGENKANAMMLDAVNYSEKIIAKANEKADSAVSDAASAVASAFALVADASDSFKTSRTNYECSFAAMENGVENLKKILSALSEDLSKRTEAE